jgi:hypothetical protein
VAAIIDDMHGVVDPCQNTRDNNSYFAKPLPGTSLREHQQQYLQSKYNSTTSLENLASQFGGSCLVKQGRPIKLEIYAFWSNRAIEDNYKLICPVGRVDNKRQVQSRFRLRIEVSNASAIDFSYFVLERPGFPPFKHLEWIGGNVVDQYGRAKSIADPQWDRGGRLYWAENIRSGHIFAEFDTIYDQWTCTLQGVWTTGKRDYNATVTAIWAGNPVELPLDVPDAEAEESEPCEAFANIADPVDLSVPNNEISSVPGSVTITGTVAGQDDRQCYQVIITKYYHPCTGVHVRDEETQVPAPCDGPDDLDGPNPPPIYLEAFIGVGDPDFESGRDCSQPCTPEGYEEICCHPPAYSWCVPTCTQWQSKNQGGLLPPGGIAALKQEYGDDVQVVWVYPEDGDCGVHTDTLIMPTGGCKDLCDGVDSLSWDADNPVTIAPNSTVSLSVVGGNPPDLPIYWEITSGSGYTLTGGGQTYSGGRTIDLIAGGSICGPAEITAYDDCTDTAGSVINTGGITLRADNPSTIQTGSYGVFYIDGGINPKTFTISGASSSDVYFLGGVQEVSTTAGYIYVYVRYPICGDIDFFLSVDDGCNTDSQMIIAGAMPITLRADNPSTIQTGSYGVFYIDGGINPKTFTISGASSSDVYFLGGVQEVSTTAGYIYVYVRYGAIGLTFDLSVDDGCNTDSQTIITVD